MMVVARVPVRIVEVGPRDGLQNASRSLTVEQKIELTLKLTEAGCPEIEIASFVRPDRVPQLADSEEVYKYFQNSTSKTVYSALVPNLKGLDRAIDVGVKKIAVFGSASETFSQKNINCSVAESIQRFEPVLEKAKAMGIALRGYVSMAFVCPDEGDIDPAQVLSVVDRLVAMGVRDISLGDTIGSATQEQVAALLNVLLAKFPVDYFAMHFHDTYGKALDNVQAALNLGVRVYDSSVGGIGGCPYAPGAKGNVATEALVELLESQGYHTGIDLIKLKEAATYVQKLLGS